MGDSLCYPEQIFLLKKEVTCNIKVVAGFGLTVLFLFFVLFLLKKHTLILAFSLFLIGVQQAASRESIAQ